MGGRSDTLAVSVCSMLECHMSDWSDKKPAEAIESQHAWWKKVRHHRVSELGDQ